MRNGAVLIHSSSRGNGTAGMALCGARTNSTWVTSRNSMLDEFVLSCGTPSMSVMIAGLAGLDPMPRKRGLLNFRAVKSVK